MKFIKTFKWISKSRKEDWTQTMVTTLLPFESQTNKNLNKDVSRTLGFIKSFIYSYVVCEAAHAP